MAALATGCGAGGGSAGDVNAPEASVLAYSELSTTSTTLLIDKEPTAELSDVDTELVVFEAAWVCELQRRTFESPAAMDEALTENLVNNGLDRAGYDTFRGRVNGEKDLRDWILFEYQTSCLS